MVNDGVKRIEVTSIGIRRPEAKWTKPHDFILERSGRSLMIGNRFWKSVPNDLLKKMDSIENTVLRLISLNSIIKSGKKDIENIGHSADRIEHPVRTSVNLAGVKESLRGSPHGIEVLEMFESLQGRLDRLEKEDWDRTENGGSFRDITKDEALDFLKNMLTIRFSDMLDAVIKGPKYTIEK